MLKLHSSDSELEFTGGNKKSSPQPNSKSNKKNRKSKSKKNQNQLNSNNISNPGDVKVNAEVEVDVNVNANVPPDEVVVVTPAIPSPSHCVDDEEEVKRSSRKQVGSSFENNTEQLGTSSSEEDECTSSSSSSSSDEGVYGYGRQAIGIDPTELENYDGRSQPLNGSQYLMMVMNEKKKIPKVAVSSVERKQKKGVVLNVKYADKFKMDNVSVQDQGEGIGQELSGIVPTMDWRENNLQEFSLLRCKVERLRELVTKKVTRLKADSIKFPELGNKVVWLKFCFGIKFEELIESRRKGDETLSPAVNIIVDDYFANFKGPGHTKRPDSESEKGSGSENPLSPPKITTYDATTTTTSSPQGSCSKIANECGNEGCQPLMSLMLTLTQQQIEGLIYFQSDWLARFGFVNRCQGEWLYALLACIDKPVEPSTMGDIRNICKTLITIRNKYCIKAKEAGILFGDDDNVDKLSDDLRKDLSLEEKHEDIICSQANEYLNAVNLFIYLIADYFCQKDLVEGC